MQRMTLMAYSIMKSADAHVQDMAYVLATAYTSLSMMVAGVYIRKSDWNVPPVTWVSYVSLTRCTLL